MRSAALAFVLACTGLQAQGHPFRAPRVIDGPELFTSSTVVMDADLDGRQDLVLGNGFPLDLLRRPAHVYRLGTDYALLGVEQVLPTHETNIVSYPAIAHGHFDEDPYPDLVSVSTIGGVSVHQNLGPEPDTVHGARFAAAPSLLRLTALGGLSTPQPFHLLGTSGLVVADLSGDGKDDLALAGDVRVLFDTVNTLGITVLTGNGKLGFDAEYPIAAGRFLDLVAHDVDRNARMDLVAVEADGTLCIARNDGGMRFKSLRFRLAGMQRGRRLAVHDVNGDGHVDYVIGGEKHERPWIGIHFGDARGLPVQELCFELEPQSGFAIESMAVADFDRDGHVDLACLLASETRRACIRYLPGQASTKTAGPFATAIPIELPARIAVSEIPYFVRMLQAVDLDGDRNHELLVSSVKDTNTDQVSCFVLQNTTPRRYGAWSAGVETNGSLGIAPKIACVGGPPVLGNSSFALSIRDAPVDGLGALIFDSRWWNRAHFGVHWHCFPTFSIAFRTRCSGQSGHALVPLAIPADKSLPAHQWTFQALVRDEAAENAAAIAASSALHVRFSPY